MSQFFTKEKKTCHEKQLYAACQRAPNYCSHTGVMSNNYVVPNIKSAVAQKFLMFDPSIVNYFGLNYFCLNNSM